MRGEPRPAWSQIRFATASAVCLVVHLLVAPPAVQPAQKELKAERGVERLPISNQATVPFRKRIALVVGIDEYENNIPPLSYAVEDARGVGLMLADRFGFDVRFLLNQEAKREGLINAIVRLMDETSRNDQLLFFFAGHGVSFGEGDQEIGYILPSDAHGRDQTAAWNSGVPMDELVSHLVKLPPKNLLIILDACYSGYAAVTPRGASNKNLEQIPSILTSQPARQLLTAGMRGQQVYESSADKHSFFTLDLLRGLEKEADQNHDGLILLSELYSFLKPAVSQHSGYRQTPYLATLDRSQGEFFFVPLPSLRPAYTKGGVRRKAVVARSGVPLFLSAYGDDARQAPFLQTYFLFEDQRNNRAPVAAEATATEPEGWLPVGSFVEWDSLEVALVTSAAGGKLTVPFFTSRDCAVEFGSGTDNGSCTALPLAPYVAGAPSDILFMVPLLEQWGEAYRGVLIPLQDTNEVDRQGLLVGWLPRKSGPRSLIRESVFMRRKTAEVLTNLVALISSAAEAGTIEGSDYFLRLVKAAFSGIGLTLEDDEQIDSLLASAAVLPFRTTSLSFTLQEVHSWKPGDFQRLNEILEKKVVALREFLQNPENSYNLAGNLHVFIPRDLFP